MDGDPSIAPWWMAGGALAAAIVLKSFDWFIGRKKDRTETDANVALVGGLTERIERLENSQARMTAQLDEEIRLRQAAQEEAHRLRLRVITLESAMRSVGAVIPMEQQT